MNRKPRSYQIVDMPAARRDTPNSIDIIWWKHWIYGLIEVDVTVPRELIREYEARSDEELSFTGFLAYCLARAVDEDKQLHAYLKGRRQLVVFDDVDVLIMVERQMGEIRAPMGHVVRAANRRSYMEINREIREVQARPVPRGKGMPPLMPRLMQLPWPLPRLFVSLFRFYLRSNPAGMTAKGGTVGITAVGMFGEHSGWGLTPNGHTLDLVVGTISRKPAVVEDRIEPREILNLTVVFDHDVVDGAPAARFVERLLDLVEGAAGLNEMTPAEAQPAGGTI
jgi:pyruvate/2-oxoglutarate dehydrogenase complex dihydrolipoamide acyltransferase (E2) component